MDKRGKSASDEKSESTRKLVEDINVTPFFKRHSGHMPISIRLHADIIEDNDCVRLKTQVTGYSTDMIDITATANTINIILHSKDSSPDSNDVLLNNSYFISTPIDPKKIKISHKGDMIEVVVPKI